MPQQILIDPDRKSAAFSAPSRTPQEGRIAIVTDVGRGNAMDAAVHETKRTDADGQAVWS